MKAKTLLYSVLSGMLALLALFLCLYGSGKDYLLCISAGTPGETVRQFYDSVLLGRYEEAYGCLAGSCSLGLEGEPEDEAGQILLTASRGCFSYVLDPDVQVEGRYVCQRVSLTCLDTRLLTGALALRSKELAAERAEARAADDVFLVDGSYAPDFLDEVYCDALRELLQNADRYCSTFPVVVRLIPEQGEWKLAVTDELLMPLRLEIPGGAV